MKKNTIARTVLAVIFALFTCGASASDTIPVPAGSLVFDHIPAFLPWMGTANPGALSENNIGNLSLVQAGYMHEDSQIRFIQQPERTSAYHAATKGYLQLGRLNLFGSFGYSNNRYFGSEYNGTLIFNSMNPYLLGDTVPDRQFKEQFEMEGMGSYRLSNRLTLAAGVEYLSAVGAKQKDPRNENSLAYLRITPGVIYNLGKTKVGLSGSVYTTSDQISYSVEGNWNQSLFVLLGLGYYREVVNVSSYSEWYIGKGYSGALQASHVNNDLYMLAELKFDHFAEESRKGSTFRLIEGFTETNDISLSGLLRIARERVYHLFTLNGSLKTANSDEIDQESKPFNKGLYTIDSIITNAWIENKHMILDAHGLLRYSFIVLDNDNNISFETGAAVDMSYYTTEHYPVQNYGYYNALNLQGTVYARKLLHMGSLNVTPGIDVSYRANLGSDILYIVQNRSLPEMVYHDYYISKAGMVSGALSLRLEKPTRVNNFIKSSFLIPEARYVMAPDTETGSLTGYMISARAGITF